MRCVKYAYVCFDSFSICFWGVILYFSFYISLKTNILQRIASESLLDRFKKMFFLNKYKNNFFFGIL